MTDTKIGVIGFEQPKRAAGIPLPPDTPLVLMTIQGEELENNNQIHITGPVSNPGRINVNNFTVNNILIINGPNNPPAVQGDVVHVGLTADTGLYAGDQVFRIDR